MVSRKIQDKHLFVDFGQYLCALYGKGWRASLAKETIGEQIRTRTYELDEIAGRDPAARSFPEGRMRDWVTRLFAGNVPKLDAVMVQAIIDVAQCTEEEEATLRAMLGHFPEAQTPHEQQTWASIHFVLRQEFAAIEDMLLNAEHLSANGEKCELTWEARLNVIKTYFNLKKRVR